MLYLDSWVWLEYVLGGDNDDIATTLLDEAHDTGAVTSTIALTEIEYITRREIDLETADYVTSSIEDADSIRAVPVSSTIARRASSIRTKYYSRRERELSDADAIHIATAVDAGCDVIHTGDVDFDDVDELPTEIHR